jgi:pimeloyl-ACP methyl ester carboxylesterase
MARRTRSGLSALVVALVLAAVACGSDSGVSTDRADADAAAPSATSGTTATSAAPSTDTPSTDAPTTDSPDTEPPVTDEAGTDPSTPGTGVDALDWQDYDDEGTTQTATLEVPVDYDDPDGPTFDLFVTRHLAEDQADKIGSLLVNPGGPGFGGSEFGLFADQIYGQPLLDRFDIVGWDPRGTGQSEPAIDCIDDYDELLSGTDITPDDDAEHQVLVDRAEGFAEACEANNADIIQHVGTNNSARDMDTLRQALGEDTISYFGFSYGSELGATWATLFPDTVRAAVLDGASDPNATQLEGGLQQTAGFEHTLDTYLASCSADTSCAFSNGGDAEGAFDALMAELDEHPIPSTSGRPDITRGMALDAVGQAMYAETFWDQLSAALAEAQDGDGSGLLALYDAYYQRSPDGTWGNELEAFQTIVCADDVDRPTVAEEDATAPQFTAVAPRFSPNTTGEYFCTFFPPSIDPRIPITGAGAGPIVVIGTTGDPATPLQSTRNMAATLEDGRLVVVTADQHTGYKVNDCVDDIVHDYLIDLDVPAEETTC